MGKFVVANLLILLLNLGAILSSLACPYCPYPTPPKHPKAPKLPPKHPPKVHPSPPSKPPKVEPPSVPKPPVVKPPPVVSPPYVPKPPPVVSPPPYVPKPPPVVTPPPYAPQPPPYVKPPPAPKVPPVTPPAQQTCPIDTLKLYACVDVLSGLVYIGIGSSAKDTCCPVLQGLLDLDAALCLCTTIKAKLLNINLIIPIALELLITCGKTPPPGFKCPT